MKLDEDKFIMKLYQIPSSLIISDTPHKEEIYDNLEDAFEQVLIYFSKKHKRKETLNKLL